jgi:hypothetical protein
MYVVNERIGNRALVYLFSYRLERCIRQRTRFTDVCYGRLYSPLLRTPATDACYGRLLRTPATDVCYGRLSHCHIQFFFLVFLT